MRARERRLIAVLIVGTACLVGNAVAVMQGHTEHLEAAIDGPVCG